MAEWLRVGRTKREVGRDIADAIITEGHTRVDFVIVAAGPNGASPHAEVSDRVLEAGDTVVVDIADLVVNAMATVVALCVLAAAASHLYWAFAASSGRYEKG